jgi:hypothetical protein
MVPKCPATIKTFEKSAASAIFIDYRRFMGFAKACNTSVGQGCDLLSSKSIQTITDLPCAQSSRRSG